MLALEDRIEAPHIPLGDSRAVGLGGSEGPGHGEASSERNFTWRGGTDAGGAEVRVGVGRAGSLGIEPRRGGDCELGAWGGLR